MRKNGWSGKLELHPRLLVNGGIVIPFWLGSVFRLRLAFLRDPFAAQIAV